MTYYTDEYQIDFDKDDYRSQRNLNIRKSKEAITKAKQKGKSTVMHLPLESYIIVLIFDLIGMTKRKRKNIRCSSHNNSEAYVWN